MLTSEIEKLSNRAGTYASIGITEKGEPIRTIGVPWETTAHAFNMRLPDVYIAPEDLKDEEIMKKISSCKVIGCYIWQPLADYGFLASFPDLQDINIKNGDSLRNLDFLSELHECRMLYLQNAKLSDLNVLVNVKKYSKAMFGCLGCVGLDNCSVGDLSVFETENVQFSEFLIWMPEGSNQRNRWDVISARIKRYYEFHKED